MSVDNTEFSTRTISPSSQVPSSARNNTACPDENQIQETEASQSVLVWGLIYCFSDIFLNLMLKHT